MIWICIFFSFWNSISGLAVLKWEISGSQLDSREVEGDDNNVEDESEEFRLRLTFRWRSTIIEGLAKGHQAGDARAAVSKPK
ncbi:hypothetical protein YC2023_035749 [Brassica napus]